jgi:oligopeptide/dipeptide ABC transporter ATP-binding protein
LASGIPVAPGDQGAPGGAVGSQALLGIEALEVAFPVGGTWVPVVRQVSLRIEAAECLGLVGESGSGKTMTALATLGLVPPPGKVSAGRILFQGMDLTGLSDEALRRVRGGGIAMVFQEPAAALDPLFTVGFQVAETVRTHHRLSRRRARSRAEELMGLVGLPRPRQRLGDFPHQLSGGQRQRVLLALALAGEPRLLIADEPTAALDTTLQGEVLDLLARLREELGLAILLITHDLGVVARSCQRAAVMYCGEIVEEGPAAQLLSRPRHPYTQGLVAAAPALGRPFSRGRMPVIPGQAPDPAALPSGCAFHPRCGQALGQICQRVRPRAVALGSNATVRCFLYEDPGP